jgi:DNA-damage-inducible protein J
MATIDVRLRVPAQMKSDADEIFRQMGMSMSEAMRIFLGQCINTGGLPFKPHIKTPNRETLESFKQIETGEYETYTLEAFEEAIDNLNKK